MHYESLRTKQPDSSEPGYCTTGAKVLSKLWGWSDGTYSSTIESAILNALAAKAIPPCSAERGRGGSEGEKGVTMSAC
jgi:hypothetical protein